VAQNNFYWLYLTYCINEAGLKEQGHFSPEALHIDLKAHFLSEKKMDKGKFKVVEVGSTTDLDKKAMMEYIEQIDNFICSFFGVDTSQFFATYQQEFSKY